MARLRAETAERTIEDVHFDPTYDPTASPLDLPPPPEGIEYGWIREALAGQPDDANFAEARQRGWVALDASELGDPIRFPTNDFLRKPGLIAMKRDARWRQREIERAAAAARSAMASVDNSMFAEKGRGFAMEKPERSTGTPINGRAGRPVSFQPDS